MKNILAVVLMMSIGLVDSLNAQEKRGWTFSLPGYNMGTTYSYYQPSLSSFLNEQIKGLGLDPVSNRRTIWNQGFIVRYSLTDNLQIGLHYNTQFDQWQGRTQNDSFALNTNASLVSYLPTAVLVFRKNIGKGYFSIGCGIGYYAVNYNDHQDSFTVTAGKMSDTLTSVSLQTEVSNGAFGGQAFLEFAYPVYWHAFYFSIRAGYVYCIIPKLVYIRDTQKNYSYYIPEIDLSGLLATAGFTIEF